MHGTGSKRSYWLRLENGDEVASVALVDDTRKLITITENGYGKRTDFNDFRIMKNRGGRGVTCHKISEKTGLLASISTVDEDDDIMMITNDGTVVRTPVSEIPVYSRSAGGVIVMRLAEGASIVNFAKVPSEEVDDLIDQDDKEQKEIADETAENETQNSSKE